MGGWVSQLPDEVGEDLYKTINDADRVLTDGVRDLRIWIRTEGKAPTMAASARADDARGVVKWAEKVRREIIWPLQASFEEGESTNMDDIPDGDDAQEPEGPRFPLLAAASKAAWEKKLAEKAAAKAPAPAAPAPAAATPAAAPAPAVASTSIATASPPAAEAAPAAAPSAPLTAAERRARALAAMEARNKAPESAG